MSARKNARRDDVPNVGWEAVDRLVTAARFNGTLTPALSGILRARTDALGATAREIGEAYLGAFQILDAREKLRAAARDAARREVSDLEGERDSLARRRKRAEAAEMDPGRVIAVAHGLAGVTRPPPDLNAAARDVDRLDDLNARIAELCGALALLDGRGRPPTAAREFAERLAPIWRRLTGDDVTASRTSYGDGRLSGFEVFFAASCEWLAGAAPSTTLIRSISDAIANSGENPKA